MSDVSVTFGADDLNLEATLRKLNGTLDGMGKTAKKTETHTQMSFASMAKAGAALAVGFGVVKGAISAVRGTVANFSQALDLGGRLSDLSDRTGEASGNLLLLERAFDNTGAGAEKVGPTLTKMQKFLTDAMDGLGKNNDILKELGYTINDFEGKSAMDQLKMLSTGLAGVEDDARRGGLAVGLFGRGAGDVIPFIRNFEGAVSEAGSELGSMVGIMNARAQVFDTISDKFAILKDKGMEFASGILSKMTPALELLTTALSRVDAAGIGERLAGAFLGAGEAMRGFNRAVEALKAGEIALSWEAAIMSVKLQFKETINSINRNIRAAMSGAAAFVGEMFGEGSAINNIVTTTFKNWGRELQIAIGDGVADVLEKAGSFVPFAEKAAKSIREAMEQVKLDQSGGELYISSQFKYITEDAERAGAAFTKSFDETYNSTKPLISITEDLEALAKINDEIVAKLSETNVGLETAASKVDDIRAAAEGISSGNMFGQFEDVGESLEDIKMPELAMPATVDAFVGGFRKGKDEAKAMKEELSASEQIMKSIAEMKAKEKIDAGGRIERQAQDALGRGDTSGAARAARRLDQREAYAEIQEAFNPGRAFGKSLKDIAKEQGIDTFRKNSRELRKELREKAREKKRGGREQAGEEAGDGKGGGPQAAKEDPLVSVVNEIKAIMQKLEQKLPGHALAV